MLVHNSVSVFLQSPTNICRKDGRRRESEVNTASTSAYKSRGKSPHGPLCMDEGAEAAEGTAGTDAGAGGTAAPRVVMNENEMRAERKMRRRKEGGRDS